MSYLESSYVTLVVVVLQLLNRVWLFVTPWTIARQASLSFTIFRRLLKLMSVESMITSNHLVLWNLAATKLPRLWAPMSKGYLSYSVVLVSTMGLGTQWEIRKCSLNNVFLTAPAIWLDQLYLTPNTFNRTRWWHPTPVLFPGKSHGQRSLVGCSPQGR